MSTDSIGSAGGRSWANLTDWWAGIPATVLENEIGEVYNDSEFVPTADITLTGKTPGAFTIILRAATGQGFADSAGAGGFKLQYDATQGAAFRNTQGYAQLLVANQSALTIQGLQFKATASNGQVLVTDNGVIVKNCIIDGSGSNGDPVIVLSGSATKIINCLCISRHATQGVGIAFNYGGTGLNITAVRPSSLSAGGTGFSEGSGSTNVVTNCASFNFTTPFTSSGWDGSSNYNCADDANAPGANSQQSKTYANQFVSTTDDWRLKAGADCIDHGNTDATNAPNDIVGTVRGVTTAGDIGAWEFVAAGGYDAATFQAMLMQTQGGAAMIGRACRGVYG